MPRVWWDSFEQSTLQARARRVRWCAFQSLNPICSPTLWTLVRKMLPSHCGQGRVLTLLGASGIVFPHINSRKDAMAAVNKVRYAYKGGERSLAPWALVPFLTDQAPDGHTAETISDEHVAVICQIETTVSLWHSCLHNPNQTFSNQ